MGRTIPALPKEFTEWSQRTALTGYNLPQEIMETIEKKHWEKTLRTMYSRAFHGLSLTFQGLSRSFHVYCIKLQFYQSWPASQRLGETSALGVVTGWVFGVRWSSGCIKNRDLTKYKHWGSNHKIINLWIEERPNYTGCIWLILDQQTTERWKMVWKNHASANLASVTRDRVFFYDSIDPFTGSPNRSIRVRYGSIINQVVLLWEERHDKHRATIHFSKFAGIRVSIAQRLGSSLVLCGHEWIKIKRHPGIDRNVG